MSKKILDINYSKDYEQKGKKKKAKSTKTGRQYINTKDIWLANSKPNILVVVSGRSSGKSYSTSKWILEDCVKNHKQFVLVSMDLPKFRQKNSNYFQVTEDIVLDFKLEGWIGSYSVNNEIVGYSVALSVEDVYKSMNIFEKVDYVIFEEFIELDLDSYPNNASDKFTSLLSTIFRNRNNGTIIMLGNNLNEDSKYNPFLTDFLKFEWDSTDIKIGETIELETVNKEFGKACLHYGAMGFADKSQVGFLGMLPNNETIHSGQFKPDYQLINNINCKPRIIFDEVHYALVNANDVVFIGYCEELTEEHKIHYYVYKEPYYNVDYAIIQLNNYDNILKWQVDKQVDYSNKTIVYDCAKSKHSLHNIYNMNDYNIDDYLVSLEHCKMWIANCSSCGNSDEPCFIQALRDEYNIELPSSDNFTYNKLCNSMSKIVQLDLEWILSNNYQDVLDYYQNNVEEVRFILNRYCIEPNND